MNMTREEAIEALQKFVNGYEKNICGEAVRQNGFVQAIKVVISALRPVSREQVEKVWRGEWVDKGWDGDFSWKIDGRGNCWKVIECSQCQCKVSAQTNFCPNCGAPMTDEAVGMVMKKLEVLHNG